MKVKKKKVKNRKLYITKKHIMFELLGLALMIAAIIVSCAIISKYNGNVPSMYNEEGEVIRYNKGVTLLIFPIIMIFTNSVLALVMHFLPVEVWNTPFEVNPDYAVAVYSDIAMMIALIQFEIGAYVLAFSSLYTASDNWKMVVTVFLLIAVTLTIIASLRKALFDNRDQSRKSFDI